MSAAAAVAIFLSNLPEVLSAAVGMKRAGRSAGYIFGLHAAIVLISALAALAGYSIFSRFPPDVIAATNQWRRADEAWRLTTFSS